MADVRWLMRCEMEDVRWQMCCEMEDVRWQRGYVVVTFDVLYSESTIVYLFVEAFP